MVIPAHLVFSAFVSGLTLVYICSYRVKESTDLSTFYVWQSLVCKEALEGLTCICLECVSESCHVEQAGEELTM